MICVLSVNRNQKRLTFFFVTALIHSLEKFWTILFAFEKTIQVELTLKDILIGVFRPECPLLYYLIRIGKIYLWSCRKNEVFLNIDSFKVSVNIKYETKKNISLLTIRV